MLSFPLSLFSSNQGRNTIRRTPESCCSVPAYMPSEMGSSPPFLTGGSPCTVGPQGWQENPSFHDGLTIASPVLTPTMAPTPRSHSIGCHHTRVSLFYHAAPWPGLQVVGWLGPPGPTSVCTRLTLWARSSRTQLKMSTTPSFSAMSSMVSMAMKQPVLPAPALEGRTMV